MLLFPPFGCRYRGSRPLGAVPVLLAVTPAKRGFPKPKGSGIGWRQCAPCRLEAVPGSPLRAGQRLAQPQWLNLRCGIPALPARFIASLHSFPTADVHICSWFFSVSPPQPEQLFVPLLHGVEEDEALWKSALCCREPGCAACLLLEGHLPARYADQGSAQAGTYTV